jgi:putative nucleotidyltransferase with HDIG domain
MCALQREGHHDPALLRAALLHDVGKAGQLRLWHRVAVVLLEALAPTMLRRLADDRPHSWRYPFFAHLHHARLGAERARATGCDALTVELIERHHQAPPIGDRSVADRLLAALQAADGCS